MQQAAEADFVSSMDRKIQAAAAGSVGALTDAKREGLTTLKEVFQTDLQRPLGFKHTQTITWCKWFGNNCPWTLEATTASEFQNFVEYYLFQWSALRMEALEKGAARSGEENVLVNKSKDGLFHLRRLLADRYGCIGGATA